MADDIPDYADRIDSLKRVIPTWKKRFGLVETTTGTATDKASFMVRRLKQMSTDLDKICKEMMRLETNILGLQKKVELEAKRLAANEKKMEGPDSDRLGLVKMEAAKTRDEIQKRFEADREKWNDAGFEVWKGAFAQQLKVQEKLDAAYRKW